MVRRKHQGTTSASPTPSNRLPALLISFSSLLLSAGLATTLYVLTESISEQLDDGDLDQAGVVAWWTTDAGFKWGLISSVGSLCGVTGILLGNASLHRVFAVSTFADLLLTLLLTFTLSLLTLLPSLAPTFGSFLCSSILSSSYDSPSSSTSRVLHVERDGGSNSEGGLLQWGVEACEENWRIGMYKVIVGCLVTIGLRVYGTFISWEHNSELRELELNRLQGGGGGDLGWVDEGVSAETLRRDSQEMRQFGKNGEESNHRRSRSNPSSSSSSRRSNTLPATGLPPRYSDDSNSRPRSQSSSACNGGRPRLVLLPVYVDRHGNPIGSPPSSPPAYRSRSSTSPTSPSNLNPPPRRSNSTKSSSKSTSRPPPPPRKRSQSATITTTTTTSKRSPSLPRYTEEPFSLSPSSSGSTTPTCLTNSSTESSLNGRSRKTRHTRSDTDPSSTAVTSGYCLTSSPTKLKVDNKALPVVA